MNKNESASRESENTATYKGRFEKALFHDPGKDYCVIRIKTADTAVPPGARSPYRYRDRLIRFVAVGYGLPQTNAAELVLTGIWETTKYGEQLKVLEWEEIVPHTPEGVRAYLASGLIKGIGEKTAEDIVARFGADAIDILENEPDKLLAIRGVTETKLAAIRESYEESRAVKSLMLCIAGFGITPKSAQKILRFFGAKSLAVIRETPYELSRISGFGFIKTDEIARKTGCSPNDPMRIRSALIYALSESRKNEGHLFRSKEDLSRAALSLLNGKLPETDNPVSSREVSVDFFSDFNDAPRALVTELPVLIDSDILTALIITGDVGTADTRSDILYNDVLGSAYRIRDFFDCNILYTMINRRFHNPSPIRA
jgi:exodeoxyribonuclease V alpha subunit